MCYNCFCMTQKIPACKNKIMTKRGLIGMIILGIFGFLLIVGIGAGIYFYNYHVFKEFRICVGEGEETPIPCESQKDCLDMMNFSSDAIDGAPVFVKESFYNILESAVYCEESCFIGMIRGIDYESGNIEELESCENEEEEFVMKIRGKEGIEILKWMKNKA